ALQHDKVPPSINYAGPNPYIDFDAVRLKVADTVTEWPRYSGYAIAGVSGFGFGAANAHVVLREVLPRDVIEKEPEPEPEVEEKPAADDANATYVGGVRFDEFGEFVVDEPLGRRASDVDEPLGRRASDVDEPLGRRASDVDEPLGRRA